MSLTSPLGLTRHLRRPDLRLEAVPWLNVLLLGLLLWMLGPRYLFHPGMALGLAPATTLPVVSGSPLPGLPANAVLTVLTAKGDDMFIFDGGIYDRDSLAIQLRQHPKSPPGTPTVLLLEVDQGVSMQTFMEICALARAAGFSTVQVAATQHAPARTLATP